MSIILNNFPMHCQGHGIECPVSFCNCSCHQHPGMVHIMACCGVDKCPACGDIVSNVQFIWTTDQDSK